MKKIFVMIVLSFLCTIPSIVNAAALDAYSIGTDYGWFEINTSNDAKVAAEAYFSTGKYNSYYNLKPTYDYLRGNNPNTNTPRMESEILFFSGHANYDHMAFNYKNKGGDYACGVYMGTNFDSSSGYKYAGVKSYNMNKVGLAIFAGCLTGLESQTNIAEVTYTSGAKVTMGWRESIGAGSHSSWLERFNKQLAAGVNVWDSVQYANGFNYADNKVKNISIYGDSSGYTITGASRSVKVNDKDLKKSNVNILYNGEEDLKKKLSEYIVKNIDGNFDLSSYKIDKNSVLDYIYYDFKYIFNGAITNSAITVVTHDNEIIEIIDNRVELPNNVSTYSIDEADSSKAKENAAAHILNDNNNVLEDQNVEKIYDENDGKFKWYVRSVVYEIDSDTYFVEEYYEEI